MADESTYGFSKNDAAELVQFIGGGDVEFPEQRPRGSGGAGTKLPLLNPGVIRVTITGESACSEFTELSYHVFDATISSYPYGSPTSLVRGVGGTVIVHDPSGCMLDSTYLAADFTNATVWASLMYGGAVYNKTFNFVNEAIGTDYVLPGDGYETLRPAADCKPFGWASTVSQTGYVTSIGPITPSESTFKVKLPEPGTYKITIVYGDASAVTDNDIKIYDGEDAGDTTLLAELAATSEIAETFNFQQDLEFDSTLEPIMRIVLSNAEGKDSRITSMTVLQVTSPSRWEAISRCCLPGGS